MANDTIKSALSVDSNQIMKLLEISQYSLIGFWVAAFFGSLLDSVVNDLDEEAPLWRIILEISLNLVILALLLYYIKKLTKYIPFCCKFNKGYQAGKTGGITIGLTMGAGLMFTITQTKLKSKMLFVKDKIEGLFPFGKN